MPFYLSCANSHERSPDGRNKKLGAAGVSYVASWRMMGFSYHVRYSMIVDRAPVPVGLGPLIKKLDASDVCAWNCLLLYSSALKGSDDVCNKILEGALKIIDRVYTIEEPTKYLGACLGVSEIRKAPLMTKERLCDLILKNATNIDENELYPLLTWYENQDWFDHFANQMVKQISMLYKSNT